MRALPFTAFFIALVGVSMGLRNHTDQQKYLYQVFGKWFAASGLSLFLLSYAIGVGSTPWIINSEIYPLHLRGLGNSFAAT